MLNFNAKVNQELEDKAREIADKPIEDCQAFKAKCEENFAGRNYCGLIQEYRVKKLGELKEGTSEYNSLYQQILACARCARGN